jgi:hypothetical protein
MSIKRFAIRIHWILSAQFGLDFRRFLHAIRGLVRFHRDLRQFRSRYNSRLEVVPCLHDWYEEGGVTKSEYFWQDLLVARRVLAAAPERHVDVGSRVDGFVAHVASFREIEVFDVRPITSNIPGIVFKQADLMQPAAREPYCDSLSCLHALEHFGLGRYGDPIDPHGSENGLKNMAALLQSGGTLYLSVPIGIERVEFNANRVFDPRKLITLAAQEALELQSLTAISSAGQIEEVQVGSSRLNELALQTYALGVFTFRKTF